MSGDLPAIARWPIAVALVMGWTPTVFEVAEGGPLRNPRGPWALVDGSALVGTPALALATIAFAVCVVGWALGRRSARALGAIAFFLLAALALLQESQLPDGDGVRHGKYMPAAVLLASLVAEQLGRPRQSVEIASGVVGGIYLTSGIAKLWLSGSEWIASGNLAMLVIERSVGAPPPLAALRLWVGTSPALCGLLAVGALATELGAIAWIVPPLRRWAALACIAMHVGIALLMGYFYVEWVLVIIGLALATPSALTSRPPRATTTPPASSD